MDETKSRSKRRGRGEGGLSYRPADGLWVATISVTDPATGQRIRRNFYGKTQKLALEKLRGAQKQVESGILRPTEDSVAAFLERWLATVKAKIRPTTYECYRQTIEKHIVPGLGSAQLARLSPLQIQGLFDQMHTDGKSGRMQVLVYTVLSLALRQARKWQMIAGSPMEGVDRPRHQKQEFHVWSAEQAQTFLEATKDHRLHPLFVLALNTGMRQGELLGLQWSDVDLAARTITVRHTLVEVQGKILGLGPVKSAAGRRTITLSATTVASLKRQQEVLMAEGLRASPYVFPARDGNPYLKGYVIKSFKKLGKKAGLPKIRFHDMRHTNATLLIAARVDPKTVQKRLGHSNISMTLGTYSHFVKEADERAATAIEEALDNG